MTERPQIRRSRSEAPRDFGPDRRSGPLRGAADRWDLWNLRALWPHATEADLEDLRRRRASILAREREALAGLWSGDKVILAPGHGFLSRHPDLKSGLLVTLHQGPYALALEMLLSVGIAPLVLVSEAARRHNEERTARLAARLGYRSKIDWLPLEERRTLPRLLGGLRAGRPVVVYLDGNLGQDGYAGTRDRGLLYNLPGRAIRVRSGLARLAARVRVPVHTVAVHWGEDGQPVWERGPTLNPGPDDDPDQVTRRLCDWCFGQVLSRPEQWSFQGMLPESAACFGNSVMNNETVPPGLRHDYLRAFRNCLEKTPDRARLHLEHEIEVWPGGVLADLTTDRFHPAAGLAEEDLAPLRDAAPTLAELVDRHGLAWVRFHALRLCLLGAARLGT